MRNYRWFGLSCWMVMLAMIVTLLATCAANGQYPGGVCPTNPQIVRQPYAYSPQPNRPTPAWRYEQAVGHRAAVVRIVCYDSDGSRSIGSGVLVRYRGRPLILTAWHVVKSARRITVWLITGKWLDARLLVGDSTWDCAALDIGEPEGVEPAELEYGDDAHPGKGAKMESTGYGSDGKLAASTGLLLGYSRPTSTAGATDWMRISGYARSGDSGGPIFSSRGRVIGVLWGTDGKEVVGTQAGRLHKVLDVALTKLPPKPPDKGPVIAQMPTPQEPTTDLADEKRLPWCRPAIPIPVPQPAPSPSVVVQSDPKIGQSLQSIDSKLSVIVASPCFPIDRRWRRPGRQVSPVSWRRKSFARNVL